MNVLLVHILDHPEQYGGVERMIAILAGALQERNGIRLAVALNASRLKDQLEDSGVMTFALHDKGMVTALSTLGILRSIVRTFAPSIVHSHHRYTTMLLQAIPNRSYGLLHTFHVEQFTRRWLRFFGDAATAVSQGCKDHFVRNFGLPEEFITVVHNGVAYRPDACAGAGIPHHPGKRVISVIARLTEQKGHAVMLRALSMLPPDLLQGLVVHFVGDGEKRAELERQAFGLGLADVVVFDGHQENVYPFLTASVFSVLPSLWEGFGLSIVESLFCGKPVIGSRVGGIPELVQDGVNGLLVPPGDAAALAGAIERLLAEADTAERMGKAGQAAATVRFTVQAMVDNYVRCYQSVIGQRHEN